MCDDVQRSFVWCDFRVVFPGWCVHCVGFVDNTVKVWSVESGECVTTFNGHSSCVTSVSFSPDGASIVSGSYDKR